jgi:hypothetical protein
MSDPSELNLVVTTDPSELSMTDMADLILLGLVAIHGYQTAPWSSTKYSCHNPGLLDLVCLLDLMCLDLAIYARPKQTTNKQRIIVHTQLLGEREKKKRSITDDNPIMIFLRESMFAYLVIMQMTRFDHREVSHAPP